MTSAGGMTKSPPNSRFCKDPAIWREVGFDQGWYKDGDSDVQLGVSLIVLAFVSLVERENSSDFKIKQILKFRSNKILIFILLSSLTTPQGRESYSIRRDRY